MTLILTADANPGTASWADSSTITSGSPTASGLLGTMIQAQYGTVYPDGATLETTVSGTGLFGSVYIQDATASGSRAGFTAEGKYFEQDGNLANNPDAVIEAPSATDNKITQPQQFPVFAAKFTLTDALADKRAFIGISSDNIQAYVGAGTDTPTDAYVGFSYSSVRADVNWQLVWDPNPAGAAQNIQDSSVAVALDTPLIFEIEFTSSTTATARIRSADYETVLFTHNITANLPPAATAMGAGIGTQYIGAGGGNQILHRFYAMAIVNRGGLSI